MTLVRQILAQRGLGLQRKKALVRPMLLGQRVLAFQEVQTMGRLMLFENPLLHR